MDGLNGLSATQVGEQRMRAASRIPTTAQAVLLHILCAGAKIVSGAVLVHTVILLECGSAGTVLSSQLVS